MDYFGIKYIFKQHNLQSRQQQRALMKLASQVTHTTELTLDSATTLPLHTAISILKHVVIIFQMQFQ